MFKFIFGFVLFIHVKRTLSLTLPLAFENDKDNPLKARVYLNPVAQVRAILKLTSRDVKYVRNKETFSVDAENSDWVTLVSNDMNPSLRYALLRTSICREKDFKISWLDRPTGKEHEAIVQRLTPTPEPWQPEVRYTAQALNMDTVYNAIVAKIDWNVFQDKLQGQEQLTSIEPMVELIECDSLFDHPVPLPTISVPQKVVYFHPSYADHNCVFAFRLSVFVYNAKNECRSLLQTTDDKSFNIYLGCSKVQGYKCPSLQQNTCNNMNCNVKLTAKAEYEEDEFGPPYRVVKVTWKNDAAANVRQTAGSVFRINDLNGIFNNYPLGNTYQEVQFVDGSAGLNITSFPTLSDGFFGLQICVFYQSCKSEPNWSAVPNHAVFASELVDALPASPPTRKLTSSTTTATSTAAYVSTIPPVVKNTSNIIKSDSTRLRIQHN